MLGVNFTNPYSNPNSALYDKYTQTRNAKNSTYLLTNYGNDKVQYYNDENIKKKEKRKKTNKILTLSMVGLATLGIAGTITYQILTKRIKPKEIIDAVKNSNTAENTKTGVQKLTNLFLNFDALKNDLWMKASNKMKTTKFDKKILKTWEGLSMSETKGRYDKLMASIKPYAQELGIEELPQDYSKWYSETSKLVGERVAPEGKRVSDVLLSGFKKTSDDQKLFDRIKSGFSTFWNKGTASIIADDNIKEVYEQCTTGLSTKNLPKGIKLPPELYSKNKEVREAALNKLTANIKEMLPNLKPEEADAKAKDIAYSLTELNKILTSGAKETIEKQRDLHLGNASVDVLGMIGSLGLLGGAVATADTKEEKTSTVLDLGIPLISTLGCSIIGGIKNISGLKSALFGLAVGQATSMAAKAIGKAVKNSKDKAMTKIEQHNTKKELVA